jgi:hypothetical protein
MARPKLLERKKPAPYSQRRGMTASAQRMNLRSQAELQDHATRTQRQQWQAIAWEHFDRIGEINFAYGLVASVMSRIRLYPAVIVDPDAPPVALTDAATIERPEEEVEEGDFTKADNGISPQQAVEAREMFTKALGPTDVPSLMRSFSLNVSVPGECYLAQIDGRWHVKSTDELRIDTTGIPKLYKIQGATPRDLPSTTVIGRIWREHPRYSAESYSSLKPLADDCDELLLLGRVIRTISRAQLNAGMLFVPDEIVVASRTETDDPEVESDEEDVFERELYEVLSSPVSDETAANAVIPWLLRGPADLGEKIRHILLERKIDEFLVNRADRTLERVLQGLDVPKDVVTGLANVKYSNAIQIDESLYKAHVEPLALMICDAITDIILRPMLRAAGWDPALAERLVVWYDPSEVTTRPDRAADAQKLYDANELSGSALRQAYGYSDADKPSEEEIAFKIAVSNIPPPEVLNILFQQALPSILGRFAKSQAADQQLPPELQSQLDETQTPGDTELPPTVGDSA